ncbi:Essential MCU regulator, mitochondrial [Mizuhopecten yessoensis]|uniref:Essential MCU regulator, mitochondrial n=1 Tax=Mizuhopecten yessoensis TaxID=6573 RepID=A0A210PS98_MIZYE|nr:Essential MCU regulator, mitochondrial [Mizuhopecten yessoensis]
MASKFARLILSTVRSPLLTPKGATPIKTISKRNVVCSESGSVLPEPHVDRLGVLKVLVVVMPFLYMGATIGKEGAAFMEENDIFVPDDDDDD